MIEPSMRLLDCGDHRPATCMRCNEVTHTITGHVGSTEHDAALGQVVVPNAAVIHQRQQHVHHRLV